MRAYRMDQFDRLDGLVLHEQDVPRPGHGQVLVKIHARSLNYRDLLILSQRYAFPALRGVVPLSDGAGEVVALGSGVTSLNLGDRVAACYFPRWQSGRLEMPMAMEQFGCHRDGMLADYVLADACELVQLPAHLSYEQGSTLPCAAVTAWNALTGGRSLMPGDTVLILGTGGVALFALQFAKTMGARAIGITSSSRKAAVLRSLGADEVIDRTQDPEWAPEVRRLTQGAGVDHVVETGAIDTLPQSLAACAANAEVALVAALGQGSLDAAALRGLVTIRRVFVGSRASFVNMNRAIDLHRLVPVIDRAFSFEEARSAYEHFAAQKHVGKVIITST
ncbi:zinc-dependent alcohol dehydrogenase family protein [Hylemonella sp. W303a]|uniref:zinc-dependent alcohol dehydrogenase family protein n=1 Tax=Hylemonella sp. W303a TaxID=3389873 RepID=UPI00396AFE53